MSHVILEVIRDDDWMSMPDYYSEKLSSSRLKRCYDIASRRIRRYLAAELGYVSKRLGPSDVVLELGCGYGRALWEIAGKSRLAFGIDTSLDNLLLGSQLLCQHDNYRLQNMNALHLGFKDRIFDLVLCIQNGISAFKLNPKKLIRESLRVTKDGGKVLFSSYCDKFWNERLAWFEMQSKAGLLGEIDYDKTKDGVIVCKDGFRATTFGPEDFKTLADSLGVTALIDEVDESSVFMEIRKQS